MDCHRSVLEVIATCIERSGGNPLFLEQLLRNADELKGDDIPLFGRIIHIADLFDALTSARSYRAAFTWDEAFE